MGRGKKQYPSLPKNNTRKRRASRSLSPEPESRRPAVRLAGINQPTVNVPSPVPEPHGRYAVTRNLTTWNKYSMERLLASIRKAQRLGIHSLNLDWVAQDMGSSVGGITQRLDRLVKLHNGGGVVRGAYNTKKKAAAAAAAAALAAPSASEEDDDEEPILLSPSAGKNMRRAATAKNVQKMKKREIEDNLSSFNTLNLPVTVNRAMMEPIEYNNPFEEVQFFNAPNGGVQFQFGEPELPGLPLYPDRWIDLPDLPPPLPAMNPVVSQTPFLHQWPNFSGIHRIPEAEIPQLNFDSDMIDDGVPWPLPPPTAPYQSAPPPIAPYQSIFTEHFNGVPSLPPSHEVFTDVTEQAPTAHNPMDMVTTGLATSQIANFDHELAMERERTVSLEDVEFAANVSADEGDEDISWPNNEGQNGISTSNTDAERQLFECINFSDEPEVNGD